METIVITIPWPVLALVFLLVLAAAVFLVAFALWRRGGHRQTVVTAVPEQVPIEAPPEIEAVSESAEELPETEVPAETEEPPQAEAPPETEAPAPHCTACGAEVLSAFQFCAHCGTELK